MREQLLILNVSEGQFGSLPVCLPVGLNTAAHAVDIQRKHDICVRANAVCIITNFSRNFFAIFAILMSSYYCIEE